ncbi:hypothetical protein V8C42DRAFT_329883 [Trichoderma barbatum]
MNAHALLSAQGWRGTGHSLHKTDDAIGLAKPLLLNRKTNTKGLGNTKHFTSDLWWMDAFDEQLKGLDTSKEGKVEQTVKSGKLNALDPGRVSKYSVYASFVRGGFLQGTLSSETTDDSTSTESDKSDGKDTKLKKESKEEKRARKEEKRKRKEARALRRAAKAERRSKRAESKKDTSDSGSSVAEEKALRRARKEEKRRRKELEKKKASGG